MMGLNEWIVSGGMVTLIGFVLKAYKDLNGKVERSYQRLDEVKKSQEDTYTRKDICEVRHVQLYNDITGIKNDITEVKSDIKLLLKRKE